MVFVAGFWVRLKFPAPPITVGTGFMTSSESSGSARPSWRPDGFSNRLTSAEMEKVLKTALLHLELSPRLPSVGITEEIFSAKNKVCGTLLGNRFSGLGRRPFS